MLRPLSLLALCACASPGWFPSAAPEQPLVVFLVRHAEKVDSTDASPLTEIGEARAEALAHTLRDAQLDEVHASNYRRTQQTAEPVASAAGLKVQTYDAGDLPALATALAEARGRHLVVGHSNTTPAMVRLLGGEATPIDEREHDRLYMLTTRGAETSTELLRYGASP